MSVLANVGGLIDRLAGNIEAIIIDRENMAAEISSLRTRLMERDKEAVKAMLDMKLELEAAKIETLRFEQERVRLEARLENLNNRLVTLVSDRAE